MASGLGLARTTGVILADVVTGGPGARAGLQPGDVVLTLDGRAMENARQFDVNLYRHRVGDIVALEVQRGTQTVKTTVAVAERADDPTRFNDLVDAKNNLIAKLDILGVSIDPTIATRVPGMRSKSGVLVAGLLTDAAAVPNGLEAGDIILAVNGAAVTALADLRTKLDALPSGAPCVLQVQRQQLLLYVVLELE
jgi:serine protease Do